MNKILTRIKDSKNAIGVFVGTCAALTGVILFGKAKIKCKEVMIDHQTTKNVIEQCASNEEYEYTEEDRTNDHYINNVQTSIKIVKLYAIPSIMLLLGFGVMILNTFKIGKEINNRRVMV